MCRFFYEACLAKKTRFHPTSVWQFLDSVMFSSFRIYNRKVLCPKHTWSSKPWFCTPLPPVIFVELRELRICRIARNSWVVGGDSAEGSNNRRRCKLLPLKSNTSIALAGKKTFASFSGPLYGEQALSADDPKQAPPQLPNFRFLPHCHWLARTYGVFPSTPSSHLWTEAALEFTSR